VVEIDPHNPFAVDHIDIVEVDSLASASDIVVDMLVLDLDLVTFHPVHTPWARPVRQVSLPSPLAISDHPHHRLHHPSNVLSKKTWKV